MITNYISGQFNPQNIYSPVNIANYGAYLTGQGPNPPPVNNQPIIEGLVMLELGLTVLSGLTTSLIKGLVKDELNLITR